MAGGHYAGDTTARKVMQAGLWWPTLFGDAAEYAKRCNECQRTSIPRNHDRMPLHPILAMQPFEKWGIDFVGPISPAAKHTQARYVLIATCYHT